MPEIDLEKFKDEFCHAPDNESEDYQRGFREGIQYFLKYLELLMEKYYGE